MKKYTIQYYYGDYNGTKDVMLPNDSERSPIDAFWQEMRPYMSLGMASQGARIINTETLEEDEEGNVIQPRHRPFCACDKCLFGGRW